MEVNGKPKDSTDRRGKRGAVTGRRKRGGAAARFMRNSLIMVLTTTMIATGVGGLIPNPLSQQLSETLAEVLPAEVAATVNTVLTQSNLPPLADKESTDPSPESNAEAPTFIDSIAMLFNSNAATTPSSAATPSSTTFLDSLMALLTGEPFPASENPVGPTFLDTLLSVTSGGLLPPLDSSSQPTLLDSIISAVTGESIPNPDFTSSPTFLDQIVSLVTNETLVSPGGNSPSDISSETTLLDSLIALVSGASVIETNNPLNSGEVFLTWLFPPASEPQLPTEQDIVGTAMASIMETQTQLATTTNLASPMLVSTQTSIPTLTQTPSPSVTTSPVPTATIAWLLPTSTKPPPPPPTSTFTPTFTPTITPTFTPAPPCSVSSITAAGVSFFNSSSTETVNLNWVDYACNVTLFATLAPGQSLGVGTYLTHAWRFTNASNGQLIGDHVVSAPGTVDIWTGVLSISGEASISSVSLNGGGSSIVVAPGQTVNVTYNFNIWDDPCPGCFTQLVTGLKTGTTTGIHGGTCAFAGDAGLYPGASGSENVNLTAPLTPGIYAVTASYQWQFTCGDALTAYAAGATGGAIGQIEVSYTAAGPANISGELWYYGQPGFSCVDVCSAHGGINSTAFDKVGGITGTNAYCDLVFDTLLGPGSVVDWAGLGNGLGCMYDIVGTRARYVDAVDPAASSGNVQRICACNN